MTANLDSVEKTFTSFIQQHLSLLLYENATFFAERMVAYRPSAQAVYLLAICHYRSNSPKRARSVILDYNHHHQRYDHERHKYRRGSEKGEEEGVSNMDKGLQNINTTTITSMTYLLAKCCFDLSLYHEAEDLLLRECRLMFSSSRMTKEKKRAGDMEEWILNTSPCPIPNGAAGLNLLGRICRRTHRTNKAASYFRMSLKLDPTLWSSYEAMCEMGAVCSPTDDPASVFGVLPLALRSIPLTQGGYAPNDEDKLEEEARYQQKTDPAPSSSRAFTMDLSSVTRSGVVVQSGGTSSIQQQQQNRITGRRSSHNQTALETPFSATHRHFGSALDAMVAIDKQGDKTMGQDIKKTGASRSLFQTDGRQHPVNTTLSDQREYLPSTNLFAFPDLTPITSSSPNIRFKSEEEEKYEVERKKSERENQQDLYAKHKYQESEATNTKCHISHNSRVTCDIITTPPSASPPVRFRPSSPPIPSSNTILRRAKQVAARCYYEPSPESTPPHQRISLLKHQHESYKLSKAKERSHRHGSMDRQEGNGGDEGDLNISIEANNGWKSDDGDDLAKRVLFDASSINGNDDSAFVKKSKKSDTKSNRQKQEQWRKEDAAKEDITPPSSLENSDEIGGVRYILELMCTLGGAQRMLCWYNCQEAIQIFQTLPLSQFNTGWVQHQVGRAYFEIADYSNAQLALENMQRLEPYRMKGLEILSTTLWHLKKEVELANLAQRAVDFDRMAPESWCVVGNCFALQKEHETALTFFRRSIQLDESFAYSHTLSGHEFVSNEDFDQAVACYRHAIRVDDRHYTAWYGLGAIYYRQEKYDLAEYHYGKALMINPRSSVLHCHLGMAQHANRKPYEALETLAGAFRIDPRNPQALYQRATIFMAVKRPREALVELEKVRDAAPREATVHFSMGRVLKQLGRPEDAMRAFLTALDLDPKDNNLIKAAIDRLDEPEVDEDVSAF